ncbi:toll/interleukin-1 receptor domain-containing protein [Brevibacillus parabrevis]
MSYLTFDRIRNYSNTLGRAFTQNEHAKKYTKKTPVFLSYWHEDQELIKAVIGFLAQFGRSVHIDWLPNQIPRTTNATTASSIKEKIMASTKFIVLATPNSIESKWIPWELGIADGKKGLNSIAILPIVQSSTIWQEKEYYGIYNVIEEQVAGQWTVVSPNGGNRALRTWLEG